MDTSLELPEEWSDDNSCSFCDGWHNHEWFRAGIESGYPLCCIIFFHDAWMTSVNEKMGDEYAERFIDGYIPCPDCVERIIRGIRVKNKHGHKNSRRRK